MEPSSPEYVYIFVIYSSLANIYFTLASLSNEQIVAELGWTMIAIKNVLGVTPNTFRPPYGDIDDRVRAVAKAMGLTPSMWYVIP